MRFHKYRTQCDDLQNQVPRHDTEEMFRHTSVGGVLWGNGLIRAESIWNRLRRPYYQVWPAIVPTLLTLDLNLDAHQVHSPMQALLIRLPVGNPIGGLPGVQTVLMCQEGPGEPLRLSANCMRPAGLITMHSTLNCAGGRTLEQSLQESLANARNCVPSRKFIAGQHLPVLSNCVRLVAMLCLLANDPQLITPEVLDGDRRKYKATGDRKYVDRARRCGKIGWNVGKNTEAIPHCLDRILGRSGQAPGERRASECRAYSGF
jgi:hypothetical protein